MTGGPERRDESVSVSLKELSKLEDERIDQEKRARLARERSAMMAHEDALRRERAELEAREKAEADERERVRRAEREEEARLEAMQRGAVEQARITVEARTRAEESERERSHERELQRMRLETQKKPELGAYIGSGLAGSGLALAAFLILFFAVARPATDRRIAELDRAVASADDRAGTLERRIEEQNTKLLGVTKELEAARAKLATALAPPPPKAALPTGKGGPGGQVPLKKDPKDDKPCIDHDPLCAPGFRIP